MELPINVICGISGIGVIGGAVFVPRVAALVCGRYATAGIVTQGVAPGYYAMPFQGI